MKKTMILTLSLAMLLTMAACSGGKNEETAPSEEDHPTTETPEDKTPSAENTAANWDGKSTADIMQVIADKADTQISAEIVDGTEYYQNALTLGELEFEEITLYMPMMSSQRFEVAVIRVKEGTNVADYVSDLEDRAANAQWICAAAPDYVKVTAVGDCVLYMAINSEFADEEAMVEAFRNPAA